MEGMADSIMPGGSILVRRITAADEQAWGCLCEIYIQSIAAEEQKSLEEFAAMAGREDYTFLAAQLDEVTVGFSIVWHSATADFSLLEYMAVQESQRGRGVGSLLFNASATEALVNRSGHCLILEVDSVEFGARGAEACSLRQKFYRRLGCRRLEGLRYLLPLAGRSPPTMDLMLLAEPMPEAVSKRRVREWLRAIYEHVYRQSGGDPRIDQMLISVNDPVKLV
jgi:GNAT superfamily N-acetyltransferase